MSPSCQVKRGEFMRLFLLPDNIFPVIFALMTTDKASLPSCLRSTELKPSAYFRKCLCCPQIPGGLELGQALSTQRWK